MAALVIYGPPGCGKTYNSVRLAAFFGKSIIVDGWDGKTPLGADVLALTAEAPRGSPYEAIPFEQAMWRLGRTTH